MTTREKAAAGRFSMATRFPCQAARLRKTRPKAETAEQGRVCGIARAGLGGAVLFAVWEPWPPPTARLWRTPIRAVRLDTFSLLAPLQEGAGPGAAFSIPTEQQRW